MNAADFYHAERIRKAKRAEAIHVAAEWAGCLAILFLIGWLLCG